MEEAYIRTGRVKYIYRPYVGDLQGDTTGRLAAEALYCAGEQGQLKFWSLHDWLYENVDNWAGANDLVGVLTQNAAPAVGLDATALGECLRQERYQDKVVQIMQDAQARGITGTPTFLVKDQLLVGAQTFAEFQAAIEGTVSSARVPATVWLVLAIAGPAIAGLLLTGGAGPRVTSRALHWRMIIAGLALVGLLVAIYLSLFELQISGSLVCPNEGCSGVNRSDYVGMFGIPIALIGVIGYSTILAVTLPKLTRRFLLGTWLPVRLVLIGLAGFGFLFTVFLTYLQLGPIGQTCTWCTVSTVVMTAIFVLAILDWLAEREA